MSFLERLFFWQSQDRLPDGLERAEKKASLDEYVTSFPNHQNAINCLPGWNQAFPSELGLNAGQQHLYADPRVLWALEQMGIVEGKRVLEIGPLEAGHTYLIDRHHPATLHAIEANKLSFLRCLVVKEILKLQHAEFFLGDAQLWLEQTDHAYDLILASGVLYHMQEPLRLLQAMGARSNNLFLWTHYADDEAMPPGDPRRGAFVGDPEVQLFEHHPVTMHRRSYLGAWKNKAFCGGMHDLHRWVERRDILKVLELMGFDDIRIGLDEPDHPYGPAFSLFARRSIPALTPASERHALREDHLKSPDR
ncbi:class I SAM-dependent methyltransferase [Rhabdaerophilum sp. SD176]|uniref:class I SAM-dependent methyltransferase n=1 Tax=Rhabdaerophilum sp. SD176 TaxID=2983548 RepID=UPI0024DF339F|nr:class I SAM-dependent methyltransferase [Rhabdaerophilum sp. SD176]